MATTAMQQQPTAGTAAAPQQDPQGPVYVDTQHDDMVHDAQLDYYGCKLATSSSDRTVKIYNVTGTQYEHTATLQGHEGPVWQVSWAHPKFGVILASASFDGSVLIHRETRPGVWSLLHNARGLHESSVNGIAFAPHEFGLMCATASSDGRVAILTNQSDNTWAVEYIKDNALGVNSISWAPFGAYHDTSAAADGGDAAAPAVEQPRLVTGGCDNRIRFWTKSATTGEWEEDTTCNKFDETSNVEHTDWVRDAKWAPIILPNMNIVASCSEDKTVIIWTQEGGINNPWKPILLNKFNDPVWSVSWSITGHMLAVASGDSNVTLWKPDLDGVWSEMDKELDKHDTTPAPAAPAPAAPPAAGGPPPGPPPQK